MKRTSTFVLFLTLTLINHSSFAQDSFRSKIYQSYIESDIKLWEETLNNPDYTFSSVEDRYEKAMAIYGFVGFCIDSEEKELAKTYLDQLLLICDQLLIENPDDPRFHALRGAGYGFQMALQMHLMMVLGPKSMKTLQHAKELGPEIPQVLVELGNQDWAMPKALGGDQANANRLFRKAITSLQADPEKIKDNWYYIKIQMILADRYEQLELPNLAESIYQNILEFEPNFKLAQTKLDKFIQ